MSLKLFKPSESPLDFPKSATGTQQKRIQNRQGFNLHKSVPIGVPDCESKPKVQFRKQLMRKFYGRKILYVTKFQEANAIVSRSKLLKYVEVNGSATILNTLKSKCNLVIFSYSKESFNADGGLKHKKPLLFQKIFRNCQKAKIPIVYPQDLKMFKYLVAVRNISIIMEKLFKLASIRAIVGNFLSLETLKITMKPYGVLPKKSNNRFFALLPRLKCLQRLKLTMDDGLLESDEMKLEIDKLYSRPLRFGFSLTVNLRGKPEIDEDKNLVKILGVAEHLSLIDSGDPRRLEFKKSLVDMAEKEKRIMKTDCRKNIVKICKNQYTKINMTKILRYCDSLKSLYIKDRCRGIQWKEKNNQKEMKALQTLEIAVLEFQLLGMIAVPEVDEINEEIPDPHPQLAMLHQMNINCPSLQRFALYVSNLEFKENYLKKYSHVCFLEENFSKFIKEVPRLDKLKVFGLQMDHDKLDLIKVGDLLSNKNLESFELQFCDRICQTSNINRLFSPTRESEIKELRIKTPKDRVKGDFFGNHLLNSIKVFNNLQIVELIDKNLVSIRINLLYEIVQSLLEKKDMRKIVICTEVRKNYDSYIERSEKIPSINDSVFQELQGQVNILKDRQLEEIFVGKLFDYSFDYMLYNKELGVTEKLLWTGEEMDQLLSENRELKRRYLEMFELFTKIKAEK